MVASGFVFRCLTQWEFSLSLSLFLHVYKSQDHRSPSDVLLHCSPYYYYYYSDLEITGEALMAGWQALEVLITPSSQFWDGWYSHLVFGVDSENWIHHFPRPTVVGVLLL